MFFPVCGRLRRKAGHAPPSCVKLYHITNSSKTSSVELNLIENTFGPTFIKKDMLEELR
jgi:hypothetical protein